MSRIEMVTMAAERAPSELDPVLIVEAALFSAGKPISLDEIAENTGISRKDVGKLVMELKHRYESLAGALEVAKAGDKWAMQVRTAYAPTTTKLAPMEIPIKLVKTLALIAYHQPVLQSDLKEMIGDKVYDHIRELDERGLVKKRVHERSYLLVTSDKFPEYFGIPASDREGIKTFLANKVGLTLPKTDKEGNARLSTFPEAAPAAEGAPRAEATPEPASAPPATDGA
ncbi:MAG TPA: SMC-Scp complex subunit ScpB [Candidatus Thermoplasmatota archaeon]|nr:SMC-Scp complex subunit ScpB [Candidatus Thermoplasmatota archaeon]